MYGSPIRGIDLLFGNALELNPFLLLLLNDGRETNLRVKRSALEQMMRRHAGAVQWLYTAVTPSCHQPYCRQDRRNFHHPNRLFSRSLASADSAERAGTLTGEEYGIGRRVSGHDSSGRESAATTTEAYS